MGLLSKVFRFTTKLVKSWLKPDVSENKGHNLEKVGANQSIPVYYGKYKQAPCIKVFKMSSDVSGGAWNEHLHFICVICEGEIGSFGEVYFDGIAASAISKDGGGAILSSVVNSEKFYIEKHTGSDSQTHSAELSSRLSLWKNTADLNGVAYLYVRLHQNKKVSWWQGEPKITVDINEGKLITDLRDGQRKYSNNLPLCTYDFLINNRYGKGLPESELMQQDFIDEANYSETSQTHTRTETKRVWDPELRRWVYEGETSVTETVEGKLFGCNVRLDTDKSIKDNVDILLKGARAILPESQGKYRYVIEKESGIDFAFSSDDIDGAIVSDGGNQNDRYNQVIIKFRNRLTGNMDEVVYPDSDNLHQTWLTEDNNKLLLGEFTIETIDNKAEALQMGHVIAKRSRQDIRVKWVGMPWTIDLEAGDVISLPSKINGWAAKPFRIEVADPDLATGLVKFQGIEHQNTIYPWSVTETTEEYTDTSFYLPDEIPTPTGFSFTETPNSDIRQGFVSWNDPNNAVVAGFRLEIYQNNSLQTSIETKDFSIDLDSLSVGTYQLKLYALNSLFISPAATKTITLSIPGTNYQGFGDPTFSQGLKKWSSTPTGEHVNSLVGAPDFSVKKTGKFGGNSIEIKNTKVVFSRDAIPVETDKHYRLRFRVRQTQTQTTGGSSVYAGVCCLDENFLHRSEGSGSYRYACALNNSLAVGSGWQEFKGIITGIGSSSGNFKSYTKYVRPMFIVNYSGGNGVVEVDYLTFEEVPDIDLIKIGTGWIELPAPGADVTNYEDIRISNAVVQAAAEDYTDALTELAEENAKAHADNVVTAAETRSLAAAQAKVDAAETRLEAFADGKVSAAELRAIAAADAKAALAETTAKAYADGIVTAAEQRAIDAATEKANTAELNAKGYVDGQLAGFVSSSLYAGEMAALQAQVDKAITTWFLSGVPTLANAPANTWTTNTDKNAHLGDLYYDNNTEYAYRFKINGSIYEWKKISDSDLTKALADAAKAQDTADSKRRVFVAQPITPYDEGDLWDTGSGIKRSAVDRTSGPFVSGDWGLVSDVTNYDDSRVSNNSMKLGGRNLFENSANVTVDASANEHAYFANIQHVMNKLAVGEEITISFDIQQNNGGGGQYLLCYGSNKSGNKSFTGKEFVNIGTHWQRLSFTSLIVSATPKNGNETWIEFYSTYGTNDFWHIKNLKIERGNKATDWTLAPEDLKVAADQAQANAISAADAAAEAKAVLARTIAQAYADDIVTAAEQRAIDDASAKANAAQAQARTTAAINAQAKINLAKAEAIAAADAAAQAKAELARTTAQAYADGIVTAEEQRAIADATAKADLAQQLAQERAQLTQSNQTLYSINGISPDVMPTGSPFALGFSGTTGFSHFSPLSDLIPVKKGETLHWEMWARQTGNTVRAYMGIERYDRNKKHIGSNSGTVYGGLVNHTLSTAWTKYTASHTLPETHTPYNGSDGRECCFVRVRLLFNYQTTGQAYYSGYRLYRVQDQQYMPNLVAAGAGTALSANPLSAIDNGSTAKINIASHTRQYGFGLITLNAGSISGLGFNTKYYVYYDDPNYTGGTMTYRATTNLQTVAASNHRIYVSAIVTPSNGGGGTKPPVEWCVTLDMWLTQQLQAANVSETDTLDLWWDGKESVKGKVLQAKAIPDKQVVYEIETSSGAIVRISESTPLELENHTIITPKALVVNQDELATLKGDSKTLVWEKVIRADIIGEQHVMHISVGDGCFAAGLDASNRIITHNGQEKP